MLIFSSLLILCVGNAPATGVLTAQRPVTRSFDVFFDLHLNKCLSKQSICHDLIKHDTSHLVKITCSYYVMTRGNIQFSCSWINSLIRKYMLYIIFDCISENVSYGSGIELVIYFHGNYFANRCIRKTHARNKIWSKNYPELLRRMNKGYGDNSMA